MADKILKYLNEMVNRTENTTELLKLFLEATKSATALLFVSDGAMQQYRCIAHTQGHIDIDLTLSPPLLTDYKIGRGEGLKRVPYSITRSLYISLMNTKEHIGVVCLLNRQDKYTEEIITEITPLLSIAQLITQNYKSNTSHAHNCKDLFMANMSHEIRTPLNGVIGYNQLLMQTKLDSTQKNYLSSMRHCSIQLMKIINDILDFFKLSAGKMKKQEESFRPVEIINAVNDMLEQSLIAKKQKFTCQIDDQVPEFIVLDKHKLIQIIINIISNAHKFTPIGGAIIMIINVIQTNTLEIRISDNGIGIAKEDQVKIFTAFEQIQKGSSKIGTGLGLAICRKLSNFLDGDVQVQSTLGSGSTFTITAKFKKRNDQESEQDINSIQGKTILVVDDNANNRILLSELLFEWDANPLICASALEALRMVQAKRSDGDCRHNIDLGLIDICMQDMSGVELARKLKQDLPLLPLIALSSVDSFTLTKDFSCKLDKPIDRVQLLAQICRTLANNQTPQAFIGVGKEPQLKVSLSSSCFNKNIRILLAEDILYNVNLLVTMLETLGYCNITTASNGKIAIEKLAMAHNDGNSYEILLLDLRMPVKDGYDVITEHIRQGWTLPKIIVVTASIMDADRRKCKEMGVKYFLNKPLELGQLREVMLYVSKRLVSK